MKYTVYQTTNLVNGKVYVGQHATEDPNDGYLGSGRRLVAAVRKYGRASFKKEVLFVFDSPEEMAAKEAEIVTREFVDREDTYNLVPGGHQGDAWYQNRKEQVFDSEDMKRRSLLANEGLRQRLKSSPALLSEYREIGRRQAEKLRSEGKANPPSFLGKKHSETTLSKIREAKKGSGRGERNSCFGTRWVCRPGDPPKKIRGTDLPAYLEKGWSEGRTEKKMFADKA